MATRLNQGDSSYSAVLSLNARWLSGAAQPENSRLYVLSSTNISSDLSNRLFVSVDSDGVYNIYCYTTTTYDGWRIDQIKDANKRNGPSGNDSITYYTYANGEQTGVEIAEPSGTKLTPIPKDTGWIKLDLSSHFIAYGGLDANIPRYKKIDGTVHLKGCVSPVSNSNSLGGTTETAICTLPSGFKPTSIGTYAICQGSGQAIWLLNATTGGAVNVSRYRDGSGYVTPATTAWMPFYITFAV